VAACAAAAGLVTYTYPGGMAAAYADLRDSSELSRRLSECECRRDQLNGRSSLVTERIALKEALVYELLDGRSDLDGVAEQFRQLNAQDERALVVLRSRYGQLSEEELATRNVLDYATARAKDRPTRSDSIETLNRQVECRFGPRTTR
jgi:hypothetical protein